MMKTVGPIPPAAQVGNSDGVVRQVVAKIQSQGLLFGIGVIVILAGLVGALVSSDLRLVGLVIVAMVLIAIVVVVGYYWIEAMRIRAMQQRNQGSARTIKGELKAENVSGVAGGVITPALEGNIEGKAEVKNVKKGGTAAGTIITRS